MKQENKSLVMGNFVQVLLDGQRLVDGYITLGAKTGPICTIYGLLHEMAHFAELELDRVLKMPVRNWDLKNGSSYVFNGRFYHQQRTIQAIEREVRVWAYETSLRRHYALEVDVDYMVAGAEFIASWDIYAKEFGSSKEAFTSLKEKVILLSNTTYSFSDFTRGWSLRIEALKRNMVQ